MFMVLNLTKQHFEILICFWFELSLSSLFLKFGKFPVLYLGCGCMTFNFKITSCSYPCPSLKSLSAKTTKYIPKCQKRSVK